MSDEKKEEKKPDEAQEVVLIPEISSLEELSELFTEKSKRSAVIDETVKKLSELEIKLVGLKEEERTASARIYELLQTLYNKYSVTAAQADPSTLPVNTLLVEPAAKVVGAGDPPPDPILKTPAGPWTSLLAAADRAKITKS